MRRCVGAEPNFARAGSFDFVPTPPRHRRPPNASTQCVAQFAILDGGTIVADANSCSIIVALGQQFHHHVITCYHRSVQDVVPTLILSCYYYSI